MENKYRQHRGFWYRYEYERNMWRISVNEDDRACSVYMFMADNYSLNEAITKILTDVDFRVGIEQGYEIPEKSFVDFFKSMQIAYNKKMAGVTLTDEDKILLYGTK